MLAGALATASPASAFSDRDCGDFANQKDAQIFFLNNGGPGSDPHDLDRDGDGIACDSNPCPCYYETHLPSTAPAPVRTRARLTTSASDRIAGEPLRITVTVLPRRARKVVLQRHTASGWVRVRAARTNARGVLVHRSAARARTTTYRALVRSTHVKGRLYKAATSPRRTVTAQRQSVALTVAPGEVTQGDRATATVVAAPVRVRRPLVVQRRTGAGGWTTVRRGTETRQGRAVFDLPTARAGTVRYRALALTHGGAAEVQSAPRTLAVIAPPKPPTGLRGTPGDASVTLTWHRVADAAEYLVYQVTAPDGAWEQVASTTTVAYTSAGLSNGTGYSFAVATLDNGGRVSPPSSPVTVTPQPEPQPPLDLIGTPGDGSVQLSWTPATGDAAGYQVLQGSSEDGPFEPVTTQPVTVNDYLVEGLTNDQSYWFTVVTVDSAGATSTPARPVQATPALP